MNDNLFNSPNLTDGRRIIKTSKRYNMGNDYKISSRRYDFDFGDSDDEGAVYQVIFLTFVYPTILPFVSILLWGEEE